MIYVVDDDDAVRDSLRILLESHGMNVSDFGSTHEFVAGYRPHPRACLILDLHLPVVGGLDFLASPAGQALDIPVILITGRGDEQTRARATELGAAAFLEKPIEDGALVEVIGATLERRPPRGLRQHT
ncbi:MAG TPA: response regulator [Stellaceae bacterium]|nr:response regulator [Stellaceae bacterium]